MSAVRVSAASCMSSQPPASTEDGDGGHRSRSRSTSASWLRVCASSASGFEENVRELPLLLDADLISWNACVRPGLQLAVAYRHVSVAVLPHRFSAEDWLVPDKLAGIERVTV